jgi:hypothetical protein
VKILVILCEVHSTWSTIVEAAKELFSVSSLGFSLLLFVVVGNLFCYIISNMLLVNNGYLDAINPAFPYFLKMLFILLETRYFFFVFLLHSPACNFAIMYLFLVDWFLLWQFSCYFSCSYFAAERINMMIICISANDLVVLCSKEYVRIGRYFYSYKSFFESLKPCQYLNRWGHEYVDWEV